jgi:O-antigen/teichoic acid export membrane protein
MSESLVNAPDSAKPNESREKRTSEQHLLLAAKGGSITFVGKIVTLASRLIIAFVLARFLGAAEFGLYNLSVSMIWVASGVALFGLDTAMTRYVAIFANRRDEASLWGTIQIGLVVTTILSLLTGTGLFMFSDTIAQQRFHEPDLAPLLRVSGLIVPFLTLAATAGAATQGFKKMRYAAIARDIVQPLIRLILILALAVIGLSAVGALLILGLAIAVSAAMLLYSLNKLFALKRPLRAGQRHSREIGRFSLSVYLTDLMILFQENIQTVLLGLLHTIANVGRFAVASQLNLIGSMFQASITTASKPIIAELYDKGDREQVRRMYQTASKWIFTFNIPFFLILVLFPAGILSLFGESFVGGATALVLLTWAKMVDVSTGMSGALIDMTGYAKLKLMNGVIQLILSLSLNIVLTPTWGLLGAAIAVLVGVSSINLLRLIEVFVLFRLLPFDASVLKPVIAGLAGLLAALVVNQFESSLALPFYAAISATTLLVVYIGMILLLGLAPEDRAVLAGMRRRMGNRLPRR